MELRLPAPCVVVLIGPSGSGKSTWASEHFEPNEVVSSDALRAMVGAGEDDQTAGTKAFDLLHQIVVERLSRGLTTVVDTTGLNAGDRRAWIEAGHAADMPVHAILFQSTYEAVEPLSRLSRTRPIPKSVLRKQYTRYKEVVGAIGGEGFDGVHTEQPVRAVAATLAAAVPVGTPSGAHTFGLIVSRFDWDPGRLGEHLRRIALRAEDVGFTDLWLMDHFRQIHQVGRPWEDMPEAYIALAHLSGVTTRIRLGALVSGVTHRNPVLLGKMLATLDVLSGGRAICGLGAAWDEDEHAAYGIDFPAIADRYDLLEDTLQMLPLLWGKGSPAFDGKTFSARELVCYPRPFQDPIPIMVGGSGEKKTLRLVAQYADSCNLFGDPDTVRQKVDVLHRHCGEMERDPGDITVTHLTSVLTASDQKSLRKRVEQLRDRNTSAEAYMARYNAGTVADLVGLFAQYSDAGADHSIVALPDVAMEGSIESFGEVIANFDQT